MLNERIPLLTFFLLLVTAGLHFLPIDPAHLYFSAADIARGEYWRLLTGHFMHADLGHLGWNVLGLGILGMLVERRSASLLGITLLAGIVSVDVLLLSPYAQLDYYCGLSGVLNAVLAVALCLEWRATRSWLVAAVAAGCILKLVVETALGVSVITDISWPPFAWSHAAGLLGGLLVVFAAVNGRMGGTPPIPAKPSGGLSGNPYSTLTQVSSMPSILSVRRSPSSS